MSEPQRKARVSNVSRGVLTIDVWDYDADTDAEVDVGQAQVVTWPRPSLVSWVGSVGLDVALEQVVMERAGQWNEDDEVIT